MHIAYTAELDDLRTELRAYFRGLVNSESGDSSQYRAVLKQLGQDGWLGIGWPREFGGQGRSPREQFVFFDEAKRAGVPIPMLALNTVGPTLMRFGTKDQQDSYLPGILAGELDFAIGYTEPQAGTDLASLKTSATRRGNEYVISGTKMFLTGMSVSDYIWLAVRTDPNAKKHRGLSIFIVPTDAQGIRYTEIPTVIEGGSRATTTRTTTITHFEDVVVPDSARVGEEDSGWHLITSQLNEERVALAAAGSWAFELFHDVVAWAHETTGTDGRAIIENAWVRSTLAEVDAKLEAMKLLNWQMVSQASDTAGPTPGDAAITNVYGTEVLIEAGDLLLEILGAAGSRTAEAPAAVLEGRLEQAYRASIVGTFAGGNNDVLRELIATSSLGMPRVVR